MSAETVKLILQGGALGVLLLILVGIYVLIRTGIPVVREFLLGLLEVLKRDLGDAKLELRALQELVRAELASLRSEVHLSAKIDRLGDSITEAGLARPLPPESNRNGKAVR